MLKNLYYYFVIFLNRIFHGRGIPVLLYHSISSDNSPLSVGPKKFEQQMKWLVANGYQAISPQELLGYIKNKNLPSKKVLITFDDGFKDNHDQVMPIFEKYNLIATFFIVGKYIGGQAEFCTKLTDQKKSLMTKAEILELLAQGNTIANHFYSHSILIELSASKIKEEYDKNFDLINNFTNHPDTLNFVAYPKNKVNLNVVRALKDFKVSLAFGGGDRLIRLDDDPLNLPRISIFESDSLLKFQAKLSAYYHLLK